MPTQLIIQILIPVFMILIGFGVGKYIERRHYRRLAVQEQQYKDIMITNLKTIPKELQDTEPFLVMGSAVIATDYFKVFVAGLRGLFGGEMKSYVTLMERARRQAVLRMLAQADQQGAGVIWNVRYETMTTGGQQDRHNKKPGGVEVLVYGTALK
jgi:uncharacterized protein YbjQ (UPF0145 family)